MKILTLNEWTPSVGGVCSDSAGEKNFEYMMSSYKHIPMSFFVLMTWNWDQGLGGDESALGLCT